MSVPSGTQFGPYRILDKIGAGGMGEVYRALDTRLNREVAIKLVSDRYLAEAFGSGTPTPGTGSSGTPGSVSHRRFLREAQSSSALNHANICTIYDIGEQDGRPFLVMELLRGETLKEALKGGPLSATEVVTFSRQAASALAAAHALGIVHRDIKPANIFVVGTEGKRQIKILDFGLAKRQGAGNLPESGDATATFGGQATVLETDMGLTREGSTLGTVAYMSPEQAEGKILDVRTDLFSLGTVMYEMATGEVPFAGGSAAAIFAALLTKDPAPVSKVNPAMPKALDRIIAGLLKKDREQRTQRAEDLVAELDAIPASGATGTYAAASAPAAGSVHRDAPSGLPSGKRIAIGVAVVLAICAGLFALLHHRMSGPPTPPETPQPMGVGIAPSMVKDSIILADFVNQTGDPVFDTTLNQALRIDLEQSPIIQIVSDEHLRQSVKYLGKPDNTVVTPAIAREIGEREGMKAILTGTIAKLGNEYLITLTAQNTATGDEIASEQAQAADKEHVVDALGKAATSIRQKLGEDLASIKKLNTPFGQATTPSLEAFRAYALGDVAHAKASDIPEAEGHYLRAIEIDPNFAMAYARLGVVYINSGQVSKANEYFSKAYALSKHVSESERLYIAGHYYENVTGNIPKVIETLQESIQTYPGQLASYININVAYQSVGQYDKALPYARKAVELQPEDAIAAENLLADLIGLDKTDEVRQELERMRRLGLDTSTSVTANAALGYFMLGDMQQMQKMVASATGRPDEFLVTQVVAGMQQYSGQFAQASATFQQAFAQAGRAKAPDAQAGILLQNVEGRALVGLCEGNEAVVQQALALDKSKQTLEAAALAAGLCGNGKVALPLAEDMGRKFPEDTLIQEVIVPLSKAGVALATGQPQKAIEDAETAKPYRVGYPSTYMQGLAYLELHNAGGAIRAFQNATQYRFGSIASASGAATFYAPSQLGLARAYAMAGDKVNAKKTYEAFFTTWKNADQDLLLLTMAKKEYAAV
jgi:serine/threonine protein kinase/tetratricopeptide (TPR) repeat protein